MRLKSALSRWCRSLLKTVVWYATDADWRRRFTESRQRIRALASARRCAIPIIWSCSGGIVCSGPFKGLAYIQNWRGSHFSQKVIGSYEKELSDVIEQICSHHYAIIVDVGAAEGFYACGLAYRNPDSQIVAFEADGGLHGALKEISRWNGIGDRITLRGRCSPSDLAAAAETTGRSLVVMDIDGGEMELLRPEVCPRRATIDIFVEAHERIVPSVTEESRKRFSTTHSIEHIRQVPRTVDDIPPGISIDPKLAILAMDECRGDGNDWLWMKAIARTAPDVV